MSTATPTDAGEPILSWSERSDDPGELLASTGHVVVNFLRGFIAPLEMNVDALRAFVVRDYATTMKYFATPKQFLSTLVFRTRWDALYRRCLREGFEAAGCRVHLAALNRGERVVRTVEGPWLDAFLMNGGDDDAVPSDLRFTKGRQDAIAVRQALAAASAPFEDAARSEDVVALTGAWLSRHPSLALLDTTTLRARVDARLAQLPEAERDRRRALFRRALAEHLANAVGLPFDDVVRERDSGPGAPRTLWFRAGGRVLRARIPYTVGEPVTVFEDASDAVIATAGREPEPTPRALVLDWNRHWPEAPLPGSKRPADAAC